MNHPAQDRPIQRGKLMTPEEAGHAWAAAQPPISDATADAAAVIIAGYLLEKSGSPEPGRLTPAEYGRQLAKKAPPLPDHAIEEAARVYAAWLESRRHAQ